MAGKRLERPEKGKVVKASTLDQIVDGANRLSRLSVAPGFGMMSTAGGPVVYDQRPRKIPVKLTSNTSPYSFVQVYGDGAGGWATLGGGITGTNSAYEYNGGGGLQNAIVLLEQSSVNDWRFYVARGGGISNCNPATTTATFAIKGCAGTNLAGAAVSVTGPSSASGTTNGSGVFVGGLTATGTYSYSVSYHNMTTATGTFTIGACGGNVNVPITLTVLPGYICCANNAAYPPTLFLTTSAGTATLTWNAIQSKWIGTQSVSVNAYSSLTCFGDCVPDCTAATVQSVTVTFAATCGFGVRESFNAAGSNGCFDSPSCTYHPAPKTCLPVAGCPGGGIIADATLTGVLPQTGSMPATDPTFGCVVPISGSMTLSE